MSYTQLRDTITNAYRMDETLCLAPLIPAASFTPATKDSIVTTAKALIENARVYKKQQNKLDSLLHQYDLSTDEGIALMCLAEALLRIPDKATMDKLISDKLSTADWQQHFDKHQPLLVNAATWSLLLTGKMYAPQLDNEKTIASALKRASSRLGATVLRPVVLQMMKILGKQFVLGETIDEALINMKEATAKGYLFSFDMLGEAARTDADAEHYFHAYQTAIHAIGNIATSSEPSKNPGISIKLSALYPRYEFTHYAKAMEALTPRLLALCQQAKLYQLNLTIDAEEADRLDISLDLFEKVFTDPSLNEWQGLGLAVQAYQKRAYYVIDWLIALSKHQHKRIMLRLIKGAYWDSEIKVSQTLGVDYPVFTRKYATDVSYLACAKKMLSASDCFYPQFGTHNAYTVAALLAMAHQHTAFEFQCLHGMGHALYDQIVTSETAPHACRIYAPVGTHKDLLGYLVRRLLENGANSSFINQLADVHTPIEKMVTDPADYIRQCKHKPHPRIPSYQHLYGAWENAAGMDLSNRKVFNHLSTLLHAAPQHVPGRIGSIINGHTATETHYRKLTSPANRDILLTAVSDANEATVDLCLTIAKQAQASWSARPVHERAAMLEKAADLLQASTPIFLDLLVREGGKTLPDAMAEIRETIDYCRYYAYRARLDLAPQTLPGPTGELNQLTLHGRGVIVCISPWNFPLAIFSGQLLAALVTGNTVIAKPAEQTPLIAHQAVQLFHRAGIPVDALQLIIGPGKHIGTKLVSDERIAGVMFTGGTETAQSIARTLANRNGTLAFLIAETGGQNAMIVDSSALPEQVVLDVVQSAFNSAGQRCSALRVLFVQEEIAPTLLTMLKGYMATLTVGNPGLLSTDIGPIITQDALAMLNQHYADMCEQATLIAETPLTTSLPGHFFAPCAFELSDISLLKKEIFGPILHVVRFKADKLDQVMDTIIKTGYGLTLGIHSRINATIEYILSRMPVGNRYVNRNMIGAVVGVQPFGGEGLSGTGPKAGGPHYLPRLCVERTVSYNTTAVGGNAHLVSLLEEDS